MDAEELMSNDEFFEYLEKRKGILDGVAITGGEPLLHTEIIEFIKKTKNPYMFLVDDMKVKIEYGNNDRKINQCINSLIANKVNAKNYQ